MARLTGKTGAVYGVTSRTTVSVAVGMTDGGAHTLYTLTGHPYWDSNITPTILVNGVAPAVAYTVDYIDGTVTFASALLITDVVTVNNIVYSALVKVGDLFGWALDVKMDKVDATAFEDVWHTFLSVFLGWNVTIDGYKVNGYWYAAVVAANNFYIRLYPDVNASPTEYFVGNGYLSEGIKLVHNAAVTEAITLAGTGEMKRKTT